MLGGVKSEEVDITCTSGVTQETVLHVSLHIHTIMYVLDNMKGTLLEPVYLGVNTTEKLDWSHHCHTTVQHPSVTEPLVCYTGT